MASQCDTEFEFRYLKRDDYGRGILSVLAQLTVVGEVSKQDFENRFDWIFPRQSDTYYIVVIVDKLKDKVIGSATLLLERKFIRNTGTVSYYYNQAFYLIDSQCGHVEDVAVDTSYRGKKLGVRLIQTIKDLAILHGCYKITLDCKETNAPFYEMVCSYSSDNLSQNGFKLKERQMTWYREAQNRL